MAYNSVSVLRDLNGVNPIPQYYSSGTGSYEPVLGNTAPFSQLVDANGLPLFSSVNPASAQLVLNNAALSPTNPLPTQVVPVSAVGYQDVAVTSTATVKLTVPTGSTQCLIYVDLGNIRARWDGGVPTTTDGMFYAQGLYLQFLTLADMSNLQVIEDSGSSAAPTLRVTYS